MNINDLIKKKDNVKLDKAINNDPLDEIKMIDFFKETLNDYDNFNELSWNKGEGYKIPNYPYIENKLEGLEFGLYLLAAESNTGKSALLMNLLYDICTCKDNNLFGIYYSLDDSKHEIIPRVIAMNQQIPISVASKPKRYQSFIDANNEKSEMYQEYLNKRETGLQQLIDNSHYFKIEDSNKIKSAEDIYEHMQKLLIFIKSYNPKANLIVGIDSINDIRFKSKHFKSTADKHSEIAQTVKQWAVEFQIPIFATTHLRKLNQNRRPTTDDLKESIEYVYESSVVWLLYNDVGKNMQAANIYYNDDAYEDEKRPVMEIHWAKNKKSSFKGRSYCLMNPEYSKLIECDQDSITRFNALIHEN